MPGSPGDNGQRVRPRRCDRTLIYAVSGHAQPTLHQVMARCIVRTAELARGAFQGRLDAEAPAPMGANMRDESGGE